MIPWVKKVKAFFFWGVFSGWVVVEVVGGERTLHTLTYILAILSSWGGCRIRIICRSCIFGMFDMFSWCFT